MGDFHGALESHENVAKLEDGSTVQLRSGGAAFLSSAVEQLRASSPGATVLLDAGDLFQGTFISNSQEGKPVIEFYNHLKVDAAAVGNHEFDFGPEGPKPAPSSPADDPVGALKQRIAEANFPLLGINIRVNQTSQLPSWTQPSVLVEKQGVKIGIIGASTPSTPRTTLGANIEHLSFLENLGEIIRTEAKALRAQGAQFVLLTIHEGGECPDNTLGKASDISECTGEIIPLAEELLGHIDAIVAGHTHRIVNKKLVSADGSQSLALMQAGSKGEMLMYADLSTPRQMKIHEPFEICPDGVGIRKDSKGKTEKSCTSYFLNRPITQVTEPTITEEDKKVSQDVAEARAKVDSILKQSANAETLTPFFRNYSQENALGNLITDLLREHTSSDFALYNNGGIRANLKAGKLTYGDIFQVLPFDDNANIINLTGEEIRALLDKDAQLKDDGAFSWSGLKVVVSGCQITSIKYKDSMGVNRPLEDGETYSVVTTGYLVSKMDSLTQISRKREITDLGSPVRDVLFQAVPGKSLRAGDYYNSSALRIQYQGSCQTVAEPLVLQTWTMDLSHQRCSH